MPGTGALSSEMSPMGVDRIPRWPVAEIAPRAWRARSQTLLAMTVLAVGLATRLGAASWKVPRPGRGPTSCG